ncbi:MAG: efflux RND transporter periplasmic adaptor subunit [Solirubrobacterales bacterium]|nr:efflux RND transporter periplasmic adaptor subunit [Solirubrobacterales bacterium]
MTRHLLALLLLLIAGRAWADDPPSVLVQTKPAERGSLPDLVEAYGTAAPALNGGMTISLQQEGLVAAIAVTPGETVRQGQSLLQFGESAAASSAYQQAVSALTLARTERAHTAQLLAQQLATRDQLAQATKAVSDAQATLDALKREGAGQAVRTLNAPFDGIVNAIKVAPGDRVQPGAPLMTLTRLDGLVVTVGIEPAERAKLRPGEPATLQPLSGGAGLSGQVLRIDGVLNPTTRLVDADIAVPPGSVISGEAFKADITVGQIEGWIVPHDAVLTDDKGTAYLFQVASNKAKRISVRVVGARGDNDAVEGNVDANRPIVVQGNYQLSDGMDVRTSARQEAQR